MESANKFEKAVFYGNNQEFQQETKEEQLIAEGCKRLIANAIILWNYLYLFQKYENIQSEEERNTYINSLVNTPIKATIMPGNLPDFAHQLFATVPSQ